MLSRDCRQTQAQFRLPHRSRWTHRVPLRVQQDYEVTKLTIKHRETEAILQKSKKSEKTIEHWKTVCAISQSGQRSSQIISKTEVSAPAHTSHDADSERPAKVAPRKHSILTHFPKDRHCEVRKRTKTTTVPRRKRTGEAVLRAENFGDLRTADHKVLSEGGESRNKHRYVVVVQDLTTRWIQSYPCKIKTSQETERSLRMFLEPSEKPKVIYDGDSLQIL